MTDRGCTVDAVPYIVSWARSEEELRSALADRLPQATVLRRMSGDRLVVRIRPDLARQLEALPEVGTVIRDELRHPDKPGGTRRT